MYRVGLFFFYAHILFVAVYREGRNEICKDIERIKR